MTVIDIYWSFLQFFPKKNNLKKIKKTEIRLLVVKKKDLDQQQLRTDVLKSL